MILDQALDRHVESKPWLVCTRGFEIYRHIRIAIRLCVCVWKIMFLPPASFEKCNLQNAKCKMTLQFQIEVALLAHIYKPHLRILCRDL